MQTTNQLEMAAKRLDTLESKLAKTRQVLEQISSIPPQIKVTVRPGSITFKLEDCTVSFKSLVDNIKSAFRVQLKKDFSETQGVYSLLTEAEDVKIKIQNIPAPEGCDVKMEEVEVIQKKRRFIPFGQCEAIVK